MSASPTLICIPDISGFTKFMSEVDFELSSKVIPSLLNKIIYSNSINLKVSEIEGDAVLFYRSGELPTFKELIDQCHNFYLEFYKQIEVLKKNLNKNPGDKKFPDILGLKIILHFGNEIGMVPIGTHIKLMGEDVITAHRFLKNDIPIDEYILISDDLMSQFKQKHIDDNCDWDKLKTSSLTVEHLGELKFHYINLEKLSEKKGK